MSFMPMSGPFGPAMNPLGTPQPVPTQRRGLLENPLLYAGLGLLSNQNAGQGLLQGLGLHQQVVGSREQRDLRRQQMEQQRVQAEQAHQARMANLKLQRDQLTQKIAGQNATPSDIRSTQMYMEGTPEFQETYDKLNAREQRLPMPVQEFEYVQQLSPEEQDLYFRTKRATQTVDVGGVPNVLSRTTDSVAPLATPEQVGSNENVIANAAAQGRAQGQLQGEAQGTLPAVEQNAGYAISVIDQLLDHPARSSIFGFSSMVPTIPGTPKADAMALYQQTQGQAFIAAREQLKGQGVISDQESAKAEAAYGRLMRAQSDEAAEKALREMKEVIELGVNRQRGIARGGRTPAVISEDVQPSIDDLLKQYGN